MRQFFYVVKNFIKMLYNCRPNVSFGWMVFCLSTAVAVWLFANYMKKKDKLKDVSSFALAGFIGYSVWIFVSTVLSRESVEYYRYSFIPFWSYRTFFIGEENLLPEILSNILFFIPFGFFAFELKKIPTKQIILFGFLFSCFIELMQLITKVGMFEFDDIFNNTAGTVLGVLCGMVLDKIKDNKKRAYKQ